MRNILIVLLLLLYSPIYSQSNNTIQILNIGLYSNTPYTITPQLAEKAIGKSNSQTIINEDEFVVNYILSLIEELKITDKKDIDIRIIMYIACDSIKKTIYMDTDLAFIDGTYYTIPVGFFEKLIEELNVNLE